MLTALSVSLLVAAFLLFRTLVASWYADADRSGANERLIVRNRISITFPLTIAHVDKVRAISGVKDVSWSSWFGGIYIDERKRFAKVAVDADSYYRLHDEFHLPSEQMKAWVADQTGAVAGEELANRYGWKVGDRIALEGTIFPGTWEFTLRGIYRGVPRANLRQFQFHWKYLNERVEESRRDQVGVVLVRASTPDAGPAIDRTFANSLAETRTESEESYERSFMSMVTTLIAAIDWTSGILLAILTLILGNTLAMGTRERISQYAAMRAVGYRSKHIKLLVTGEAFVIAVFGAAVGIAVSPVLLRAFADLIEERLGMVRHLVLTPASAAAALGVAIGGAMLAASLPARRVAKMPLSSALRTLE
jgi:putative ABC transport system permease protein